jgi:hypothetical protein
MTCTVECKEVGNCSYWRFWDFWGAWGYGGTLCDTPCVTSSPKPLFCDIVRKWVGGKNEYLGAGFIMSDDDYEDGEILEEGEEPEVAPVDMGGNKPSVTASAESAAPGASKNDGKRPQNDPAINLLPPRQASSIAPNGVAAPSHGTVGMKRSHSEAAANRPPARHATNGTASRPAASSGSSYDQEPSRRRDDTEYSEGMILRFPRQVVSSNVLLNFALWAEAFTSRSRKRLDVDDLRDMILNVLDQKPTVSPFLMDSLFPTKAVPSKVCVVLLGNLHPAVLQRQRPDLPFFDGCTSVPCMLSNASQDKRKETPLSQLLYRFPKPPVDTKYGFRSIYLPWGCCI